MLCAMRPLSETSIPWLLAQSRIAWFPSRLDDAPRVLAYQGERRMAEKALAVLAGDEQI